MSKYRKRPVEVDAMLWDGTIESQTAITNWADGPITGWFDGTNYLAIYTLEGEMRADVGDYIIKGVKGEFYPCKPDIFALTYEPVERDFSDVTMNELWPDWMKSND